MIDFSRKPHYDVRDLVELVRLLRAPGGCAWDGVQTHASIRRNLIEEAYEAAEAIDEGDSAHLREELGDVLLQVVFHAGIEQDAGRFDFDDVCDAVCRKLIDRHPHLFSGAAEPPDWEALKRSQRGYRTLSQSLSGVSRALPALWRAEKLLSKAEAADPAAYDSADCAAHLSEEIAALGEADPGTASAQAVLGRTLFETVRLARRLGVDPEEALHGCCDNFTDGVAAAEAEAAAACRTSQE